MSLTLSVNEKNFILQALKEEQRIDGRRPFDYRRIKLSFGPEYGQCEAQIGKTRVYCSVTGQVVLPFPDRPTEGQISFNIEFSPMAAPGIDAGRPSMESVELTRMIERIIKGSRALDTEALCIVAGEKVWSISVDLHMLDDCGNLIDCAALAALAGLLHYRRPDVTIEGQDVQIHSMTEREPVPLSIHHLPICVSFAFFQKGELVVVDPETKEEAMMLSRLTLALTNHKELCGVHKAGGVPVSPAVIFECTKVAAVKAAEITDLLRQALDTDAKQRAARRSESASMSAIDVNTPATVPSRLLHPSQSRSMGDALFDEQADEEGTLMPVDDGAHQEEDDQPEEPVTRDAGMFQGGSSSWDEETESKLDSFQKMLDVHSSSSHEKMAVEESVPGPSKGPSSKQSSKKEVVFQDDDEDDLDLSSAVKKKKVAKKGKKKE